MVAEIKLLLLAAQPPVGDYSGFDSAVYRNLNAEWHFPQENDPLHDLNMATRESKPL